MINVIFTITFALFVILTSRLVYRKGNQVIASYKTSIAQQFEEAENLLKEAQHFLQNSCKEQDSIEVQSRQIIDLAKKEAQFIMEKNQEDMTNVQKNYLYLFEQQSEALIHTWHEDVALIMWHNLYCHAGFMSKSQSQQEVVFFVKNKLEEFDMRKVALLNIHGNFQ